MGPYPAKTAPGMLVELSAAVESRDPSTRGHAARVTALADAVARRLGWHEQRIATLRIGCTLHDVGKVAVPDAILFKPGPLTDEERVLMERHPVIGSDILREIDFLGDAKLVVRHHHERWDGAG